MNPNYIINDYEDKDWQGVSKLFKNIFSIDMNSEYFKWKNSDNPQGKSIIKIASNGDEILGLSCIWKFSMNFLGESILAGQSVDAMVDKNHRRMNIFENMSIQALEDMKNQGFQLRFNFPNEAAYLASINKINIKKVCDIPQYIKILKSREALSMFSGNKIVKLSGGFLLDIYNKARNIIIKKTHKYDIREIEYFDQSFDTFWDKVKSGYPITVERSSKYLNWRYSNSPNKYKIFAAYKNDEIIAYIVTTIENKIGKNREKLFLGHIVDLMCSMDQKDAVVELIIEAEKYLKSNGVCAISCWMIKEWFYSGILAKLAFLQFRSPSVLAVLPVGEMMEPMRDYIYDYKNWYVTIGDSDYI